ncbi:coagulation factor XIII B chain-like isoform X1 [Erpetoichthys calabaricus]|uniref:coagulation factor XIII B chain-like isoform X1 n=1 Tax=Erpetoichthys calabaricus TaxID=27687 RepID=UPI0022349024|nr:coagulation factor XIII B chain-like isoform X1 [Erpetoichthys calabaricus]
MRAVFTTLLILVLHCTHCMLDSRTDKDNLEVCTLSSVTNGSVPNVKDKYLPGEIVLYSCEAEYVSITGLQWGASQCKSGEWHPVPQCTKKTCEQPSISDGWIKNAKHAYDIGTTLEYECYGNLVPAQEKSVCTIDGWSSQPLCQVKPKVCILPDITHAYLFNKKKEYNPEEILTFTCDTGYKSNTRSWWGGTQCKAGEWQPTPECIDEGTVCPDPPRVENAIITQLPKLFVNQDTVEYVCIHTNERHNITCVNRTWTSAPSCSITCSTLIQDRTIIFTPERRQIRKLWTYSYSYSFPHEDVIQYSCIEGYKPDTKTKITCGVKGWEPSPKCSEIICDKPDITAGYVQSGKAQYKYKERLLYACHKNFKPTGVSSTCTEQGWNPVPVCESFTCERPNTEYVGNTNNSKYIIDETIDLECPKGYKTKTNEQRETLTCTESGWQPPVLCEPIMCSINEQDRRIVFNPSRRLIRQGWSFSHSYSFPYEEVIQYSCTDGFKPVTKTQITCRLKGWDPSPKCIDGRCSLPPKIDNGDIQYDINSWYKHGAEVTYQCKENYVMEGDSVIQCSMGVWSKPPQCMKACYLKIQEKAIILKHGNEVKILCPSGNPTTIRCENGQILNTCKYNTIIFKIHSVLPLLICSKTLHLSTN